MRNLVKEVVRQFVLMSMVLGVGALGILLVSRNLQGAATERMDEFRHDLANFIRPKELGLSLQTEPDEVSFPWRNSASTSPQLLVPQPAPSFVVLICYDPIACQVPLEQILPDKQSNGPGTELASQGEVPST